MLPGETRSDINASLQAALQPAGLAAGKDYSLENYLFIPASAIDATHPLVDAAGRAVTAVTGSAKKTVFEATCEAPFFSVGCQIPTLIVGPGDLSQAHVKDEFVRIEELHQAAQIYASLALDLLK
ncbi:M20/M25/M40 family metallo-hydrolase [Trabulsiella odontotermitis]|uniref:M20/M25/M40 family metallo-hydrolase n=1 Tax=Trabulsiella odontotermitis TaxID=379893 RepID=UPI001EE6E128|nr:M20/M25/M40 family metallo-hydrolase [Trabulsiella odontotermitis]